MAGKRSAFLQTDVTRAIRAVKAARVELGRVEIRPDGRIVILPMVREELNAESFEKWEAGYRARQA